MKKHISEVERRIRADFKIIRTEGSFKECGKTIPWKWYRLTFRGVVCHGESRKNGCLEALENHVGYERARVRKARELLQHLSFTLIAPKPKKGSHK